MDAHAHCSLLAPRKVVAGLKAGSLLLGVVLADYTGTIKFQYRSPTSRCGCRFDPRMAKADACLLPGLGQGRAAQFTFSIPWVGHRICCRGHQVPGTGPHPLLIAPPQQPTGSDLDPTPISHPSVPHPSISPVQLWPGPGQVPAGNCLPSGIVKNTL